MKKEIDVICFGEALIDFVSTKADVKLRDAPGFVRAAGGAPANVAAGLGKLGVRAAFMGMVGKDEFGEHLREVLRQNNVDVSLLQTTTKANTTLAFVSLTEDGERDFAFYRNPGADLLFGTDNIDESVFDGPKIFHFGSLSLVDEPARSATFRCVEIAKSRNMFISYDPNWRPLLWPDQETARKNMLNGLILCDWLKISEEELFFLSELDDEWQAVNFLVKKGPSLVCVTKGAKGATVWHKGNSMHMDAPKVNAVDTTGAGDAFWAAFLPCQRKNK